MQIPPPFPRKSLIEEIADQHPYWSFDYHVFPDCAMIRVRTLLENQDFLFVQIRLEPKLFHDNSPTAVQFVTRRLKEAIVSQIAFEKSFYN